LYQAKQDYLRVRALEVAEAGVEQAIAWLKGTAPDGTTNGSWRTIHPNSSPDNHANDTWYEVDLGNGESYKLCVRTDKCGDTSKIVITSVSTVVFGNNTASRTLKVRIERIAENVNCWNNVIFAGVGQMGHSINGNVVMRGSVHLLGDGEPFTDIDKDGRWDDNESYTDQNSNGQYDFGEPFTDSDSDGHRDAREPFIDSNGNGTRDPALKVTDLAEEISGTADVGNNYSGMSVTLKNLIPSLPTNSFGGETVETLSAKLRVKHGLVGISGSATVGWANTTGNTTKETMDGVYVTDGYTGNKGAANVYSDNGTGHSYDLGDGLVKFPNLSDPYPGYGSYQDYLASTSFVVPSSLTIDDTSFTIGDTNGSISYNATTKVMQISGKVYVNGDITFNESVRYSGKGTLVATENITVEGDLLPQTKFPTTDAIGLIAAKNMTIGDSAQRTIAAACYAQYKIYIPKQSEIAGSCVSSYFSVKNVPHLFQAPDLANNLPPGMPGGDPIWIVAIKINSWQDMGGSAGIKN
jgi:hypothetical protein